MHKGLEAEQLFFVVCCSTNIVIFKSVCLLAIFFVLESGKFVFREHCKIAIGIKPVRHVIFSFAFASYGVTDLETCI